MRHTLHIASLPALALLLALSAAATTFAQDAMAPAGAMAPGAMTPMSDADFEVCTGEASTLSFEAVKLSAMAACDGLHKGVDVMGALQSMHNRMSAMAPADSMAPADAMAPAAK
ncbi:MAG: hypothetical protein JWQ22_2910 [Devosia sp.]|nr:hypothetical protein [Devosia sp.]